MATQHTTEQCDQYTMFYKVLTRLIRFNRSYESGAITTVNYNRVTHPRPVIKPNVTSQTNVSWPVISGYNRSEFRNTFRFHNVQRFSGSERKNTPKIRNETKRGGWHAPAAHIYR